MSFEVKTGWYVALRFGWYMAVLAHSHYFLVRFLEINEQWPGLCTGLRVEQVLWDKKSKYQHVVVFKSEVLSF